MAKTPPLPAGKPFFYSGDGTQVPDDVVWVIILSSVRSIPPNTFHKCVCLERVDILEGLETIGRYAFFGCSALKLVRLPKTTRVIGEGAFSQCSALACVVLNEGLVDIGSFGFNQCVSLESFCLPSTVKHLGESFCQCCTSLEEVGLNEGLLHVPPHAFDYCDSLKVIGIPDSIERVGRYAIPKPATREFKKPAELWTIIREKVAELADSILPELEKTFEISQVNLDGRPIHRVVRKPASLDAVTLNERQETKDNRENRQLRKNHNAKVGAKKPQKAVASGKSKTGLVREKAQRMKEETNKAAKKMALSDTSRDAPAHDEEPNEFKKALVFLLPEDQRQTGKLKLKLSGQCDTKESLNCTTGSDSLTSLKSNPGSRLWEEHMQNLEANMKQRMQTLEDNMRKETQAKLSLFQNQIADLRKEVKKNHRNLPPCVAKKLEKISADLHGIENRLEKVADTAAQYSETQLTVAKHKEENDTQLKKVRTEYTRSQARIRKKMDEVAGASEKALKDTCALDERMNALEKIGLTSQSLLKSAEEERSKREEEMNTKYDTLTSNVGTLSQTIDDQNRTFEAKSEHCLEVVKRIHEFQLEHARKRKKDESPIDEKWMHEFRLEQARKRKGKSPIDEKKSPQEEVHGRTTGSVGIGENLRNWLLPRKKAKKGQDE